MKYSALFFVPLLFLGSCRQNPITVSTEPSVPHISSLEKRVIASDNAFGLKLFNRISAAEKDSNIFISPLSVSMALGMTMNGANGGTLDSMKKALQDSGMTMVEIDQSYKNISAVLPALDQHVAFQIANSIWYRNGMTVLNDFKNSCSSYFDAAISSLDFNLPSAVSTINGWVSEKTNGTIPTVLDNIPPDAMMYLINAIYFKGAWTYEFDPEYTKEEGFTTASGTIVHCPMMSQHATYAYYSNSNVQVIDLPYGDGSFSMTVILPSRNTPIDQFAASLDQEQWDSYINNLDSSQVDLFLPKFTLKYTRILNQDLAAMGMGIAFTGQADFSNISSMPLYISYVLHKTFVDVDEMGTEAAAVTAVGMFTTVVLEPTYPTMLINHPFIFAIREHASGAILFIGKVTDPTQ